ncbi:MAG: DUF1778 domain-containing protein [Sumerlaeia bacterium]
MQTTDTANRTKLSLRCLVTERDLIDRAAEAVGESRTEFMLKSSCEQAKRVLLDQRTFTLPEDQYEEFVRRLDAPVENEKLKALLAAKAPWER